jgi:hypothetical protein
MVPLSVWMNSELLSDPAPVSLSVGRSANAAYRQTPVVQEKLPFRAPLAVGDAGHHGTVSQLPKFYPQRHPFQFVTEP